MMIAKTFNVFSIKLVARPSEPPENLSLEFGPGHKSDCSGGETCQRLGILV